uniref:Retinoic acid receptor responder protein 2 n=1 Tax=Bos mutus grunniens TaxID=30521 RepID=A0A8B9XYD8_BOSMU
MVRIRGWSLVYQKTGVTGGQGGGGGSRPCSPAAGPRTGADPAPTSDRANLGWAWEQWGQVGGEGRARGTPGRGDGGLQGHSVSPHLCPEPTRQGPRATGPRSGGSSSGPTHSPLQGPGEGGEAMWQLLLPLALGLGTMGLGRAELTTAQHRGLQVALEEFHKHPPVLWAFQVTSVDNAADTLFPAGQFVRLEFKLQQTSCRKKDWRKEDCKVKPNGRKRKCLAYRLRFNGSWTTPRTPSAAGWSAPARTPTATTSPDSLPSSKPCPPELRPGRSHPASWKEGRSPVKACLPPLGPGRGHPLTPELIKLCSAEFSRSLEFPPSPAQLQGSLCVSKGPGPPASQGGSKAPR